MEQFNSIDGLGKLWKNIQKNSELYLTFESVKSYVETVAGSNIVIFVSDRKDSILPLRFEENPLKQLYLLICQNFGYNLETIGNENEEFLNTVIASLVKKKTILHLEPLTKEFSESIKKVSDELGLKSYVAKSTERLYRLKLKESWKDFLDSLDSKFRKNLRYYENKIKEGFKLGFQNDTNLNNLSLFFELHSLSMRDRGELSILEFKKFQNYYTTMISNFGENAGLFNLSVNEKVVASLVYVDWNGVRYFLNIGINPEYKNYSVSRILIAHAIEDAIKKRLKYFDFGKGDDAYKLDWGCEIIENYKAVVGSSSLTYTLHNLTGSVYNLVKWLAIRLLSINLIKSILLKR